MDMVELALGRLLRDVKEGWKGSAPCLVPAHPWERWPPKLRSSGDASLLVTRSGRKAAAAAHEEGARWAVMKLGNAT